MPQAPLDAHTPRQMGRYVIVGHLASGGMAEILLGKSVGPGGFERAVVVKRILPHLARQPAIVNMFLDEARLVAQINHPNVVQVYELGRDGDELFQVFEYLNGESAVGLMRRMSANEQRLPLDLAAYIVAEATAGIAAAHALTDAQGAALNVVHRDISPENVFITYEGVVKVLDFGIARMENRLTQTSTGETKGKFAYMAPEQVRGEEVDARADLFSLGVVLHELTTGARLFRRDSPAATLNAVCELPIPSPASSQPAYPKALEAICMRALDRDRARRYATAVEMRKALLAFLRDHDHSMPHQHLLGNLMRASFRDRIEEKRAMLAKLQSAQELLLMPAVEVDAHVELPLATTVSRPPPSPRTFAKSAGIALLISLVGGFYLGTRRGPGASAPEPPPSAVAAASAPAPAVPPVTPQTPSRVHLEIRTSPPGAQVLVDGTSRGTTPWVHDEPRRDGALRYELRMKGFAPVARTLPLGADQMVEVELVRSPSKKSVERRPAKPPRPHFERL